MKSVNEVRTATVKFFADHVKRISADTLEWMTIIVLHAATVPSLVAMMAALTDRTPPIDVVLFIWGGLMLLFVRAILLKNSINIITNGFGFVIQAMMMALILFK